MKTSGYSGMRYCTLLLLSGAMSWGATEWALIRTTDGTVMEARVNAGALPVKGMRSFHSGAAASAAEQSQIDAGIAAIQGTDRAARDAAVEELTAIGVPVVTPLLKAFKDTDQHEPRPLYRLFERVMPSRGDGFDRTMSLVRMADGEVRRVAAPAGNLELQKADGSKTSLPWASVRTLAVRNKELRRIALVHSLRHCTQIEYMDTGIVLSGTSKVDSTADGFVRLSWNEDGWATDPDGLKKPGSPAYKTNLFAGHPFGALVGRVGAKGEVFVLGRKASKSGLKAGKLLVAVNDNPHWQNNVGTYTVVLVVTDAYDVGEAQ